MLKKGQHIQVDFLTPLLSDKSKKILNLSVNLIALISACIFFISVLDATQLYYNLGQMLDIEISVPIWWMFLAFPVGFFILGLVSLELLIDNFLDLYKK